MTFNPSVQQLTISSLAILACALLLIGAGLLNRSRREERSLRKVDSALAKNLAPKIPGAVSNAAGAAERRASTRWLVQALETPLGRALVAAEDRQLLDQCGLYTANARAWLLGARFAGAVAVPLLVWAVLLEESWSSSTQLLALMAALVAGTLLPKWALRYRAAARREQVVNELPLLVDLLRLLQGVGLSLDQSLQVVVTDFKPLLQVLGQELESANRQFSSGRTRQQSLQRMATGYDNDDLAAIVRLLIQVDKHGGAVQEPLKQFGERLREHRRSGFKDKIGKLNVKMTGVMVLTLLPALLIVVAGPGFIAVIRSLSHLGHQ